MIATTTEVAFLAIPSMFLFLFAFIGTLGLFLLHMKTRTVEFALRMALGARRNRMVGFVVMESITVSIVAMVPGLVLALFIYEFTLTNLIAIMITFLMMLLFSVLSAWYPAYSVSKINPAISLHYE